LAARWRTEGDKRRRTPAHVVWEITLSCNLKCRHCGSRAGAPRADELDTAGALALVDALADAGVREISLIGGEAYLRRDWLEIVAAITRRGIYCAIQSGGRALTRAKLEAARAVGLGGLGISIDGDEASHDELRGVRGSYAQAVAALRHAKALGLNTSVNSQINARSRDSLDHVLALLVAEGIGTWQPQLTVAMGNAADNDALLLQPHEVLDIVPKVARLCVAAREHGITVGIGNNIGYFGPYERLFRSLGQAEQYWTGCEAGATVMGIEADGTIKGCPSLETRKFGLGSVKDRSLQEIWDDAKPVRPTKREPADPAARNFCGACYYRDVCLGGCTWTADSLTGNGVDNPFCHYRALRLQSVGLRERIAKLEEASPLPFGVGRFAVVLENADGSDADDDAWRRIAAEERAKGRAAGDMIVCEGCHQFHGADDDACPHCSARIAEKDRADQLSALAARRAMSFLQERLTEIGVTVDQPIKSI
jgi:radical SAM protein with 4Fe4S-binding SPASM domain